MTTETRTARIRRRIAAITSREETQPWLDALGFPLK
jgi:hypothetical protein